jgi:L,D-transpeptidase YbiS
MPAQPYIWLMARNHRIFAHRDRVMLDALASTERVPFWISLARFEPMDLRYTAASFIVQSKLTNPVWVKPDWAFVEEGLEVPKNQADRMEPGVRWGICARIRQGVFHPRHALHPAAGKN